MKRIAILQSNYIPWKGYFDMIASVDEFILYDDVQFTRRDWRNRNQIKTPQGLQWLTIPVKVKGNYSQPINQTEIDGHEWAHAHWRAIQRNYARANHFKDYAEELEQLYKSETTLLSDLNRTFIEWVCSKLGITTKISMSSDYALVESRTERLLDLCIQTGANEYTSGPAAKDYLDEKLFSEKDIAVRWFDYSDYPEYPQLWGDFTHTVTVLDLLLNCGPDAPKYMKFVGQMR